MKHYDLNGTQIIEAMETPWIYCNDNLTPDEKQSAYDDVEEWFLAMAEELETKRRSAYPNVVYIGEFR
jgi:hypothetical protein